MLDFREEITKYKPVLGLEDVEQSVQSDEIKDVMDLLQYITKQIHSTDRE